MPAVPGRSILIHAGDWSMLSRSMAAVRDFGCWLRDLPYNHKLLVSGNHDCYHLDDRRQSRLTRGATILHGYGIEIEGLSIWGIGWLDTHHERIRQYARIPTGVDLLVTHAPAYGILDGPPSSGVRTSCKSCGS